MLYTDNPKAPIWNDPSNKGDTKGTLHGNKLGIRPTEMRRVMPKIRPDLIRNMLNNNGWSQEDLAEKAGVNTKTVTRMLKGLSCNISTISFVAGALKVQPAAIIDDGTSDSVPDTTIDQRIEVSIKVLLPYDTGNESKQAAQIVALLTRLIEAQGVIAVNSTSPGSVKLNLEMDQRDVGRLFLAFIRDELGELPASELILPFNARPLSLATSIAFPFSEYQVLPVDSFIALTYFIFRLQSSGVHLSVSETDQLTLTKSLPDDSFELDPPTQLKLIDDSVYRAAIDILTSQNEVPEFPCTVALRLTAADEPGQPALMIELDEILKAQPSLARSTSLIQESHAQLGSSLRITLNSRLELNTLLETVFKRFLGRELILEVALLDSTSLDDPDWALNANSTYRMGAFQWKRVASMIREVLRDIFMDEAAEIIPNYDLRGRND